MNKALAVIPATLALAAPATARIHEPFTLEQANRAEHAYETAYWRGTPGITLHFHPCRWKTRARRNAVCTIDITAAFVHDEPVYSIRATDLVTRRGDCALKLTQPGVASGTDTPYVNGCFHGPLAVIPQSDPRIVANP